MRNGKFQCLLVLIVVALIVVVFTLSDRLDHKTFDTIENNGEISVIESGSTVFIPEGAYLIGNAYAYNSTDDDTDYTGLFENKKLAKEILVKTNGKVILYWNESQREQAQSLDNK